MRFIILWLVFAASSAYGQTEDPVQSIQNARTIASDQNYKEALEKTLSAQPLIVEQYGSNHIYNAYVLDDLSRYSSKMGLGGDALKYSNQALATIERLGAYSEAERYNFLHNKATALLLVGNPAEAISLYEEVLEGRRQSDDQVALFNVLDALGRAHLDSRNYDKAIQYLQEAEATALSLTVSDQVKVKLTLARAQYLSEKTAEAEQILLELTQSDIELTVSASTQLHLLQAQIAIERSDFSLAEQLLSDVEEGQTLSDNTSGSTLAAIHYARGNIALLTSDALVAKREFEFALEQYTGVVGPTHPATLRAMHSLALAYRQMGDFQLAISIFENVIAILESTFGKNHIVVAESLVELSSVFTSAGDVDKALQTALRAQHIYNESDESTSWHKGIANAVVGFALAADGLSSDAETQFNEALSEIELARGHLSSDLVPGLLKLSDIQIKRNALSAAEQNLDRARHIIELQSARTIEKFGELKRLDMSVALQRNDCANAAVHARIGIDTAAEYIAGYAGNHGQTSIISDRRVIEDTITELAGCLSKNGLDDSLRAQLLEVLYLGLQLPSLRSTSAAVSQLGITAEINDNELADLLEKRKHLAVDVRRVDTTMNNLLGSGALSSEYQDAAAEQEVIRTELATIDERINGKYPEFSELVKPRPVTAVQVQQVLNPGEAVLQILLGRESSTVVLTKADGMYFSLVENLGASAVAEIVEELRFSLDFANFGQNGEFPEFDTDNAYTLYEKYFLPFAEQLEGVDHVITIADGSLQRLPLSLLLSKKPLESPSRLADFMQLQYLNRLFSFSYLPSPGSLVLLRRLSNADNSADMDFVGFGDPLMINDDSEDSFETLLKRGNYDGAEPSNLAAYFTRLPESATELQNIQSVLNSERSELYLGKNATRQAVLDADYDNLGVLAFATHGVMADELSAFREPGLLMSQTSVDDEFKDVLLSASDIATLQMDVDWVLLSACNTAAPESIETGAEGLSGLARSFFYAGARALLVSHWYVETQSASELTTRTIDRFYSHEKDNKLSKSKALQATMNEFIDGELGRNVSHPAYWAPFVVVGES